MGQKRSERATGKAEDLCTASGEGQREALGRSWKVEWVVVGSDKSTKRLFPQWKLGLLR